MENVQDSPLVRTPAAAVLDLLSKVALLSFLVLVMLEPAWGNLTGKAPTARALTYPLVAFAIPAWWVLRRPHGPYPWLPDLLLTLIGFSDVLGNRLGLYDKIVWFDDWMHFMNVTCLAAALVLISMVRTVSLRPLLERSIALGMTAALGWEVFEYVTFLRYSTEVPTAYGDTIGDLVMGWFGTIAAALLVHLVWRSHLPAHRESVRPDRRGRPVPLP
jgi:hypothetical protein